MCECGPSVLTRPEKGVRFSGLGVTGGFKLLCEYWENLKHIYTEILQSENPKFHQLKAGDIAVCPHSGVLLIIRTTTRCHMVLKHRNWKHQWSGSER